MTNLWAWLHSPPTDTLQTICILVYLLICTVMAYELVSRFGDWVAALDHRSFLDWLGTAPMTNLRMMVGICLAVLFVLATMVGSALGLAPNETILLYVGGFILVQMGLDVAQFGVKRATFDSAALGMTREGSNPAPATPAADLTAAAAAGSADAAATLATATGKPPVMDVPPVPGRGD